MGRIFISERKVQKPITWQSTYLASFPESEKRGLSDCYDCCHAPQKTERTARYRDLRQRHQLFLPICIRSDHFVRRAVCLDFLAAGSDGLVFLSPDLWRSGMLAVFMGLALVGIGESAMVAVVIFITHLAALTLLVGVGGCFLMYHGTATFAANWQQPVLAGDFTTALFLGFSAAMLGISGFESSANFVEEQQAGVFRKTLRNMWVVVSFFNPVIALLALAIIPLAQVGAHRESFLAFMGATVAGNWLGWLISVDAVLVLSGAVLTSFVGVTGLVERITLDRVLPNYFLAKNRRGANYRIIIGFFILCVTVLFTTRGDLVALAGVYTF